MRLSAPKRGTFVLALLLGALAILSHYGGLRIPIVTEGEFLIMTLSLLLLLLGSVLKGF